MTESIVQTAQPSTGPPTTIPQLDEGVWQAWVKKGREKDLKLAGRMKWVALIALISVVAFVIIVVT